MEDLKLYFSQQDEIDTLRSKVELLNDNNDTLLKSLVTFDSLCNENKALKTEIKDLSKKLKSASKMESTYRARVENFNKRLSNAKSWIRIKKRGHSITNESIAKKCGLSFFSVVNLSHNINKELEDV